MKRAIAGCLVSLLILISVPLKAQMINPDIDKSGQPFSYPACSTDEIAVQNSPLGTEITPEGYLYTGYGELMFSIGDPPQPVSQRIRTLEKGYLPIVHYTYSDGSVRYDLTAFSGTLPGQSADDPVNFIRVVAKNTGARRRTSYFSAAFPYTGGACNHSFCSQMSHRFRRPVIPAKPGDYSQPGVEFNPHWIYGFTGDLAIRSGKVVYEFPVVPRPVLWLTENDLYSTPEQTSISPKTPVLMVQYELHLEPERSQTLIFKMPVRPIFGNDATAIKDLKSSGFNAAFKRTEEFWGKRLDAGIQISLPEKVVTEAFKANLIFDMMARERVDGYTIQTVNDLQYHAFWLRDGSHIMNAYDLAGFPNLVRRSLPFFLTFQKRDGLFISQSGQYDGWGQALWTLGRYYQFSHDRGFAQSVLPAVVRAVDWLEYAREKDPLHIMPAANPGDDEFNDVRAHVTGHNFWALAGLKEAIVLAKAVGAESDVHEFQQDYNDYHQVLFRLLDQIGAKDGDYIPPGIDIAGGQDWGNMNAIYPEMLLPASDPLIAGTLRRVREEYAEGLMTYAGRLHDYIGFTNTETELILGERHQAVKDLYAELAHTSSTHAGWEVGPYPWTTRDFGNDLAPHGWFAAEYVTLLRNMLIREQGDSLHLLSAVSPDWTEPGDTIEVSNAPTEFGRMGMECRFSRSGMRMALQTSFARPPGRIVIHMPWFVTAKSASVDGKPTPIHDETLSIPASSRQIDVIWTTRSPLPLLSYQSAVKAFLEEYRARYRKFLRDGSPARKPIKLY
ncbi:MAG: hypothetical protein ACRD2B_00310 [Terriglobia bacterium]